MARSTFAGLEITATEPGTGKENPGNINMSQTSQGHVSEDSFFLSDRGRLELLVARQVPFCVRTDSLFLFGNSWEHHATHSIFLRLLLSVVENTLKGSCVDRIHIRFTSQSSAQSSCKSKSHPTFFSMEC